MRFNTIIFSCNTCSFMTCQLIFGAVCQFGPAVYFSIGIFDFSMTAVVLIVFNLSRVSELLLLFLNCNMRLMCTNTGKGD